ncbi:MAG: permease [Gammaproteobacteria bacterium]|nr:permease [Gammaproteobacteria bacterium]|tara:strand:+ start:102893 stop:103657 length:765 start_codon:yes stop_codon:yes gene_type:complete
MEYELNLLFIIMLIGSGFVAGFINTIAGGGSMLTLPALMMLGMPADVANGTNRIGIFLQSIAGARRFQQLGKLEPSTIVPTLIPALTGSLLGSLLASFLPVVWLKPILLITMLSMAIVMLVKPSVVAPPVGTRAYTIQERPMAWFMLFLSGVYGGFIQAGVGFILIAALAGTLRYDLVRANALKVAITIFTTTVALGVYILRNQVLIVPGLLLALGAVVGAVLSVKFAISMPQAVLKWILFVMVSLACLGAYFS